jgi:hypothetical protein
MLTGGGLGPLFASSGLHACTSNRKFTRQLQGVWQALQGPTPLPATENRPHPNCNLLQILTQVALFFVHALQVMYPGTSDYWPKDGTS